MCTKFPVAANQRKNNVNVSQWMTKMYTQQRNGRVLLMKKGVHLRSYVDEHYGNKILAALQGMLD